MRFSHYHKCYYDCQSDNSWRISNRRDDHLHGFYQRLADSVRTDRFDSPLGKFCKPFYYLDADCQYSVYLYLGSLNSKHSI